LEGKKKPIQDNQKYFLTLPGGNQRRHSCVVKKEKRKTHHQLAKASAERSHFREDEFFRKMGSGSTSKIKKIISF